MRVLRDARVAWFLASRSVARGNAGVTIMSVAMMSVVFVSVMFLPSLIGGAVFAIDRQIIDTMTGDLVLTSADDATIDDAPAYLDEISAVDGVAAVTGIRRVGIQIAYGDESNAWGVDAIDPGSYAEVFTTPQNLIEGTFLDPGDTDGIVLGIDIAGADLTELRAYSTSLKSVHAGDRVEVTLVGGTVDTFVVRGIYRNNFPLSDQGAFITMAAANQRIPGTDLAADIEQLYAAFDAVSAVLAEASARADALASGATQLATGAADLATNASGVASASSAVDSQVDALADGAVRLDASATELAAAANAIASQLQQLATELTDTVTAAAGATAAAAVSAAEEAAALAAACPATADPAFCAGLVAHADAAAAAAVSASTTAALVDVAAASSTAAAAAAQALASRAGQLAAGIHDLASSATRLAGGTASLAAGASQLASAAAAARSAAENVALGAQQLSAGLLAGAGGIPAADPEARKTLIDTLAGAASAPAEDSVTRIVVATAEGVDPGVLGASLVGLRDDIEFQSPEQLAAAIQDQLDTFGLIDSIMRVISLLVAAITVFILTYVELTNRRRQIGIERAIGIHSTSIVGAYVIKTVMTAAVGIAFGLGLFHLVVVPLVDRFPFIFPNGPVTLHPTTETTVANIAILLVVAVVSSIIPSIRTVSMKILDAIWGT